MGIERADALHLLEQLIGTDLHEIRRAHPDVTVYKDDKLNKGWAGHVIERYLGLPLNSSRSPNFGSWELKVVPVRRLKSGVWVPKETMAITMLDAINVRDTPFEKSHLLTKLQKQVLLVREDNERDQLKPKRVFAIKTFDLEPELYREIEEDYEAIRQVLVERGMDALSGTRIGTWVQQRTKGAGHGTKSRAFYAKKLLLKKIFDL